MTTERKPVAEATEDEINAELDDRLGVDRTARTEDTVRIVVRDWFHETTKAVSDSISWTDYLGGDPWGFIWKARVGSPYQADIEEYVSNWRKPVTPYCSSWEYAMALGKEMENRGLHLQYGFWLRRIVFGQQWLCDQSEFETAHATPRQRAEAALMVLREAQGAS